MNTVEQFQASARANRQILKGWREAVRETRDGPVFELRGPDNDVLAFAPQGPVQQELLRRWWRDGN